MGTGIKNKAAGRKVGGEGLCVGDGSGQEGKAAAGDLLQSWDSDLGVGREEEKVTICRVGQGICFVVVVVVSWVHTGVIL